MTIAELRALLESCELDPGAQVFVQNDDDLHPIDAYEVDADGDLVLHPDWQIAIHE